VITVVFFYMMSDFAKFITQKELSVYLLNLVRQEPSSCYSEGICIVGLVDLQALHGANI
jgi:hypothetical protein